MSLILMRCKQLRESTVAEDLAWAAKMIHEIRRRSSSIVYLFWESHDGHIE
jgi:hypothetical protein